MAARAGGRMRDVNELGPGQGAVKRTQVTKQTQVQTTTTTTKRLADDVTGLAKVEHLGRRAGDSIGGETGARTVSSGGASELNGRGCDIASEREDKFRATEPEVEGNRRATTISTIAAQSSQSRIVVALLRDGQELQLKIQEMRPGVFEVGASLAECAKYLEEHRRLLSNLSKQKDGPIEAWLAKYKKLNAVQPNATAELRLIYLCMAENLQGCWRALLGQLELRLRLLDETCAFFKHADQLAGALELADGHVQTYRREFLDGPGSVRFKQAANELRRLNAGVVNELAAAKSKQKQLVELIGRIATSNLGDSRTNILIGDAQNLINFIQNFIEPLERRKIQLESVLTTTTSSATFISEERTTRANNQEPNQQATRSSSFVSSSDARRTKRAGGEGESSAPGGFVREIGNFNDLNLAENWLNVKVDQLNSSLLSSLGSSAPDSRSILNKHEQIALECSAIEEATLNFNGKNIHALKSAVDGAGGPGQTARRPGQADLFAQQKQLAERARDVITILDARIVLLRRTIDFYSRAKDATVDINKMMRRLQVDNSLQSVQFVADELELKDVSSVVASGATIISELQQLQLAQQHGHRSTIVNLNLVTSGIRAIIDQLNQDLAHLKTVLSQRRLVLLNEDATKMAQNFTSKCHQLKFWLDNHVKSHLLASNRLGFDVPALRAYCDSHEQLRLAVQQKTLEVEALLRLLSTLTESFDAKSRTADEIQRDTDELRQDWIGVTNCLDARLEFARKYLAILTNLNELGADIDLLGRDEGARPRTPDERTEPDIKSAIEQAFAQLTNQVKNFTLDASKIDTALVYAAALESKSTRHDINKQQVVGHANGALKLLSERNKSNINRLLARGPRRWPNETNSASTTSVTTTITSTSTSTKGESGGKVSSGVTSGRASEPPTSDEQQQHQQEEQARVPPPPRFARQLADMEVEPFSSTTLECELDPASGRECRVEWLLNNKRIPGNIKHSTATEATRHRLIIAQFGPMCCGVYTARATNQSGQSTSSSCNLRLSGIREHDEGEPRESSSESQQMAPPPPTRKEQPPPTPRARPITRWLQNGANGWQQQQRQVSKERALERIIQGVVESPADEAQLPPGTQTTATTTRQVVAETSNQVSKFPVTQVSYDGNSTRSQANQRQQGQRLDFIDSPAPRSSASGQTSRSISTTPFEGTPQPPVFAQGLRETSGPTGSQAGLVCVVIGNPPPNVEWLHNQRPIASAKCAQPTLAQSRANICKLTIETLNDKTRGQYVCRATNRLGQTTSALTLTR